MKDMEEKVTATTYYECDENGNIICSKTDVGDAIVEQRFEYDEKNRMIKKFCGKKKWEYQYDGYDNVIYYRVTDGGNNVSEWWDTYNGKDCLVHTKRKSDTVIGKHGDYEMSVICKCIYDENGNVVHRKVTSSSGLEIVEEWKEYNEHNKITYYEDNNGIKVYYFYDESGKTLLYSETRRNKNQFNLI